jgi:hypothetical protein
MAAAVSEGYCVDGEAYGTQSGRGETVLYSGHDTVLARYFQVGQEAARRFPPHRQQAVGRTGGPSAGLGRRWSSNVRMEAYDHGWYWRRPSAIDEIARVLPALLPQSTLPEEHQVAESIVPEDVVPVERLFWDEVPPLEGPRPLVIPPLRG